ncbi:MAG: ABC transporter permease [Phycisphaerales bacterium]|jgi:ABC-2 type transport system permease protein|nr:ABC transporter permease [Phycisphaerales bacterium]
MIAALVRMKLNALRRNRVDVLVVCLLPIVFYAIFAGIFGGMTGDGGASGQTAIVVDEDQSESSKRIIDALGHSGAGLRLNTHDQEAGKTIPWTADAARAAVRRGSADAAIIIPKGVGVSFGPSSSPSVRVLVDPANPIAGTMIPGLLQQAAMTGLQAQMMREGIHQLEQYGGALTPKQRDVVRSLEKLIEQEAAQGSGRGDEATDSGMLLPVKVEDVAADSQEPPRSMATYYVAAIGVMFLLFSVAGAAGSLLEDQEAGILDRLLFTPLGMTRLLLASGLWMAIMASASMVILFIFATIAFDVGPWTLPRLLGCALVTVATAIAASALGLLLAALCRTRSQLAGVSTIVILAMSAIGGSMIPRFVMPEAIREIGWYTTFNAWAVEGYLEIFWYTDVTAGVGTLVMGAGPSLLVLFGMSIVFFTAARCAARRWERT